jgi:hypothetical protein
MSDVFLHDVCERKREPGLITTTRRGQMCFFTTSVNKNKKRDSLTTARLWFFLLFVNLFLSLTRIAKTAEKIIQRLWVTYY